MTRELLLKQCDAHLSSAEEAMGRSSQAGADEDEELSRAQVHATLALAYATRADQQRAGGV